MHQLNDSIWEKLCNGTMRPLKKFLEFYGENIEWLIQQIVSENSTATQMINDFAHYGVFDILIPLNEMFSIYMSQEALMSWRRQWDKITYNSKIVYAIADSFHEQLVQKAEERLYDVGKIMCTISECFLYKMIWESYPDNFWQYPQQNTDIYLGMLVPGMYVEELREGYINDVYNYVLPQIFILNRQINKFPVNTVLRALVYKAVLCYSSELGEQYYTMIACSAPNIICSSKMQGNDEEYACFFEEIVQKQSGFRLNMNIDRVEKLEKLSDYVDQYGLTQYSCRKLQYVLPIAQQLVGKIKEASKKLIIFYSQVVRNKRTDRLFLLAYYRMWVRETDVAKQQAYVILNELNTGTIEESLKVYRDIEEFYKQFCFEFAKRFEKNGLTELVRRSSGNDVIFYRNLWHPNIKGNRWFYETLVKSNKLSQLFEFVLQKCEKEKSNINITLEWMYRLDTFIQSLISHLPDDNSSPYECFRSARVNPTQLVSAMRTIDFDQYLNEPPAGCTEIFGIYSPSQVELLVRFDERIREMYRNLPGHCEKNIAEVISNSTINDVGAHKATWEKFEYFNSAKNKQFELLCRDLFRKMYFDNDVCIVFDASPNNCGIEINPVLCSKEGKYISFQAKYTSKSGAPYDKFLDSATKTVKYYGGKINLLILYCNRDFDLKSKAFLKLADSLKAAEIEVKIVCNQAILDIANSDRRLLQKYFGYGSY